MNTLLAYDSASGTALLGDALGGLTTIQVGQHLRHFQVRRILDAWGRGKRLPRGVVSVKVPSPTPTSLDALAAAPLQTKTIELHQYVVPGTTIAPWIAFDAGAWYVSLP